MRVTVTADHVRRGVRYDCRRCAVALALREWLPPGPPLVFSGISIVLDGRRVVLPKEARDFSLDYDEGRIDPDTFPGLTFELGVPRG